MGVGLDHTGRGPAPTRSKAERRDKPNATLACYCELLIVDLASFCPIRGEAFLAGDQEVGDADRSCHDGDARGSR